jgi:hypothetical protein
MNRLVRHDGLVRQYKSFIWIKWKEDRSFRSKHKKIAIGRSLMFGDWLTTTVTEILEESPEYIKFKTKNSTYELFINK